ncbi:hypothetical protein AY601_4076 [Pedobacter cryoconitis]|uniref:Uncharacterized protein n=1 Tax=Pedobacter cryoconitis TaxID=188932 RepID=A0A127VHY8_9SPHI|nr:hypothetical protein [Pedobacter cryoconitis]AMQ00927.1 hypothetical protein AY601_4076 [Pedobacter cryoconitis]
MDYVKLAETVQQMRAAQNEYFRTRSGIALNNSKKLEKEVDDMVKAFVRPQSIIQADMFGKGIPVTDPNLKHEIKFCLLQELDINEHGKFIYTSTSGVHSMSMPDFLSDFREWLNTQGITKDYQIS